MCNFVRAYCSRPVQRINTAHHHGECFFTLACPTQQHKQALLRTYTSFLPHLEQPENILQAGFQLLYWSRSKLDRSLHIIPILSFPTSARLCRYADGECLSAYQYVCSHIYVLMDEVRKVTVQALYLI